MTWLDTLARRWGCARDTTRPRRFRPDLEALQRRDVPTVLLPASISGFVYCDCNNNGTFDQGESPISGVTVTLSGTDVTGASVNLTTTTGANGQYTFDTLPDGNKLSPGTYTVHETQPAGVADGKDTQGTPASGTVTNDTFVDVQLGSGVNAVNYNFGEQCQNMPPPPPPALGSLCGVVYIDCNKNGMLDKGESGIPGVTVTLTGPNGFSRTATTDASGRYTFDNLAAGTYTVTETQPAGFMQGTNTAGTPTNGTVNGDMISGVVVSGTKLTGYNFGETSKDCGCDHGKGSHGKGSGGKGSSGKGSHGMCDNGSHGKGSHGKGSGGKGTSGKGSAGKGTQGKGSHGKGSHGVCDNGSHGKGTNGKGSGGKGSGGKGSNGVCDNGSHGKGTNAKGSHGVCDNGSHARGSNGKGSSGKGSHGVCDNGGHNNGSHDKGTLARKGSHAVCGDTGGSPHC